MDPNHLSLYAKKIREVMKVLFFMIRKGKRKLLVDLNLALKRGKLAGKSLIGKLAHHHHHHKNHQEPDESDYYSAAGDFNYPDPKSSDYVEFSCSNTPAHHKNNHHGSFLLSHVILHLINGKKGRGAHRHKAQFESVQEEMITERAVECALNDVVSMGSPALPGLGFERSPAPVRQLRVTDSPYPVSSGGDSGQVDADAEEFIRRFYSNLLRQPIKEG